MNLLSIEKINSIINSLCHDIWKDMKYKTTLIHTEEELWKEIVRCVLSSQVKFELSEAFFNELCNKNLLSLQQNNISSFEKQLLGVLQSPININGYSVKYRFPKLKAKQIATARCNIYGNGLSLKHIMDLDLDANELRDVLVKHIPGLGMKQASMFLRNIGKSFDLAVIDSHIIKYMKIANIQKSDISNISKKQYLMKENTLKVYADNFGYPLGCVDYAIWIVMRVASRERYI